MTDHHQPPDTQTKLPWLHRQWQRVRTLWARDIIIGQVEKGASNVIIGKNNVQVNVGGRNLTLPIWLIAGALLVIISLSVYKPLIEPWLFPTQMNAVYNIAVAEFGVLDERGRVQRDPFGATLSRIVYDKLATEYEENAPGVLGSEDGVLIWEDSVDYTRQNVRLGVITGATPMARAQKAKRLAEHINAHLVVYGYLQQSSTSKNQLMLEFYVASETTRGEPDAISGRHLLGQAIPMPIDPAQEAMSAAILTRDGPLSARSQLLFWLTLGLTYDAQNKQDIALAIFQEAKAHLNLGRENGAALLEYFIGREAFFLRQYDVAITALERAKMFNPTYANAWITLANLHYDRAQLFYLPKPLPAALNQCVTEEQLANAAPTAAASAQETEQAVSLLRQALHIADESPWPPIAAVGHLSLGNAYRLKGQVYLLAQPRDLEEASKWFNVALQEFQTALSFFKENEQTRYVGWTQLGMATTHLLQAYVPLQQITLHEDLATANLRKQESVRLFQLAAAEAQQCIDLGEHVNDLAYKQKVLDCGCVYYQVRASELAEQVQATIKEQ